MVENWYYAFVFCVILGAVGLLAPVLQVGLLFFLNDESSDDQ